MSADDFQRYLRAKRTVDDRALDTDVLERLEEGLAERAAGLDRPLRVLEVGAGIGTMVERFLEWDVLPPGAIHYTALDVDPANVGTLRERLADPTGARRAGEPIRLERAAGTVTVEPVTAEATEFIAASERSWDLLVGAALLDILGIDTLEPLLSALAPGGYAYFPITFDGGTRFLPSHPLDREIERRYHAHMDRKPSGTSRAGLAALDEFRALSGATVLGVAGSDWVVRPDAGDYPADEAYFLRFILETVGDAVGELAGADSLPQADLDEWLETRRRHLDDGELVYVTHQLDLLGRTVERV